MPFTKLAELRARTDRDLLRILHNELDRGLALANVAASRQSVFRVQAEGVYTSSKALLPRMSGLDPEELAELEWKLKELSMALELVSGALDLEHEAACCC